VVVEVQQVLEQPHLEVLAVEAHKPQQVLVLLIKASLETAVAVLVVVEVLVKQEEQMVLVKVVTA